MAHMDTSSWCGASNLLLAGAPAGRLQHLRRLVEHGRRRLQRLPRPRRLLLRLSPQLPSTASRTPGMVFGL
jgi:hypothetical protein